MKRKYAGDIQRPLAKKSEFEIVSANNVPEDDDIDPNEIRIDRDHESLMAELRKVPGVKEHLSSFSVVIGKQILKRRIGMKLTQQALVEFANEKGISFTQSALSKAETGQNVESETYNKIFKALGLENAQLTFIDSLQYDVGLLSRC